MFFRNTYLSSGVIVVILLTISATTFATVRYNHDNQVKLTSSNHSQPTTPIQPDKTPITANSVVAQLNQQRKAKGLGMFNWVTQLNTAAVTRANYMVANDTVSTSAGNNAWTDVTEANYNYSNGDISDTYNDTSTQEAVSKLTTGENINFGYSTAYKDIGVGVVPDTINGSVTQLVVVYIANQVKYTSPPANTNTPVYVQPPDTTYTPSTSVPTPCPIGDTGTFPYCQVPTPTMCPFPNLGTEPNCECPIGDAGIYPNCVCPSYDTNCPVY